MNRILRRSLWANRRDRFTVQWFNDLREASNSLPPCFHLGGVCLWRIIQSGGYRCIVPYEGFPPFETAAVVNYAYSGPDGFIDLKFVVYHEFLFFSGLEPDSFLESGSELFRPLESIILRRKEEGRSFSIPREFAINSRGNVIPWVWPPLY